MYRHVGRMLMLLAICTGMGYGTVVAQDNDLSAAIHSGTCDALGDQVASLQAPRPASGPWVGVEGIGSVLESETDDVSGVTASALIGSPHAVVVSAGGTAVACGEVGGNLDDDDSLHIGLAPVDDSGSFGIAELDDFEDDDDELDVDLWVMNPTA